jgi:hypothetical protein
MQIKSWCGIARFLAVEYEEPISGKWGLRKLHAAFAFHNQSWQE